MVLFMSSERGSAKAPAPSLRRRDGIPVNPEDFLVLIARSCLWTKSLEISVSLKFASGSKLPTGRWVILAGILPRDARKNSDAINLYHSFYPSFQEMAELYNPGLEYSFSGLSNTENSVSVVIIPNSFSGGAYPRAPLRLAPSTIRAP